MQLTSIINQIRSSRTVKIAAAMIILVALGWYLFKPGRIPAEVAIVARGSYEDFLEEEGMTRVKEKFIIYAPVSGVLERITLHSGDRVTRGMELFAVNWEQLRRVRSPIDGHVLRVIRESAGPVVMQEPIMEVGNLSHMEVAVEALTQDAVRVDPGDTVEITGWGGKTLKGTIRLVEPAAFTRISSLGVEEQRTRVLVDFAAPDTMGEAFKVQCKILLQQLPDRVVVPSAALFRDDGQWALFTVEKGRAKKIQVEVEARNSFYASITKGVTPGMEVILYPSENIADGIKVERSVSGR